MKKLPTLKRAKVRAWDAISLYVRQVDADPEGYVKCFTCSTTKHWKELDAGHFIHNKLDYDLDNLKPQCFSCNRKKSGNLAIYLERLLELCGHEVVEELMRKKNIVTNYTVTDLLAIEEKYKNLTKEL